MKQWTLLEVILKCSSLWFTASATVELTVQRGHKMQRPSSISVGPSTPLAQRGGITAPIPVDVSLYFCFDKIHSFIIHRYCILSKILLCLFKKNRFKWRKALRLRTHSAFEHFIFFRILLINLTYQWQ